MSSYKKVVAFTSQLLFLLMNIQNYYDSRLIAD